MSWSEVVYKAIEDSNDSCARPDGIPFAVYRTLTGIAARLILGMLIDLAGGKEVPIGFNEGRLFLIPKDDSYKVLATRPISVNNSENRLVAKAMAAAITPAVQGLAHTSQKGFVEGRHGSDNIFELTEEFYSAHQNKRTFHLLQIDTH